MPALFWLPARLAFGFNKPKINILGNEFAGEIAAVGNEVTLFKVGDQVFGYRSMRMGVNAGVRMYARKWPGSGKTEQHDL
jgi:NADPH:quinone reductase-like Zn-dependent oxidoreductase